MTKRELFRWITVCVLMTIGLIVVQKCYGQPDCGRNSLGRGHIEPANIKEYYHSAYFTFGMGDASFGLRYDQRVSYRWGGFVSGTKGKYRVIPDENIPHYKVVAGPVFYPGKYYHDIQNIFFGGISHHSFQNQERTANSAVNSMDNYYKFQKWSWEIGTGMIIGKGFSSTFRFDFRRDEGTIEFGWSF